MPAKQPRYLDLAEFRWASNSATGKTVIEIAFDNHFDAAGAARYLERKNILHAQEYRAGQAMLHIEGERSIGKAMALLEQHYPEKHAGLKATQPQSATETPIPVSGERPISATRGHFVDKLEGNGDIVRTWVQHAPRQAPPGKKEESSTQLSLPGIGPDKPRGR